MEPGEIVDESSGGTLASLRLQLQALDAQLQEQESEVRMLSSGSPLRGQLTAVEAGLHQLSASLRSEPSPTSPVASATADSVSPVSPGSGPRAPPRPERDGTVAWPPPALHTGAGINGRPRAGSGGDPLGPT